MPIQIKKLTATAIKAANDGTIKKIDSAADALVASEIKKIQAETKEKERIADDFEKNQKTLQKARQDVTFCKQKYDKSVNEFWAAHDAITQHCLHMQMKYGKNDTFMSSGFEYKVSKKITDSLFVDEMHYKKLSNKLPSNTVYDYKKLIAVIKNKEQNIEKLEKEIKKYSDIISKANDKIQKINS